MAGQLSTDNEFVFITKSPTIRAYLNSTATIRLIVGPVGSGKSAASCARTIINGIRQPPNADGVRERYVAVIRSTMQRLEATAIPTFYEVVPRNWIKNFSSGRNVHADVEFLHPSGDGTIVKIRYYFIPLADQRTSATKDPLDKLLSMNLSDIWAPEATEIPEGIISVGLARCGRAPSNCLDGGLLMDINPAAETHWLYNLAYNQPRELQVDSGLRNANDEPILITTVKEVFEQPPGAFCTNMEAVALGSKPVIKLNPNADNLENLSEGIGYYAKLVKDNYTPGAWGKFQRSVLCQWVNSRGGSGVWSKEVDPDIHFAEELLTDPTHGLIAGFDTSGLHPCVLLAQMVNKELRIVEEVFGENIPFRSFLLEYVMPALDRHLYSGVPLFICDPANPRGIELGFTPMDMVRERGWRAVPAPTCRFQERREAVSKLLNSSPGVVISKKGCPQTVEALMGGYAYEPVRLHDGSLSFKDMPAKDKFSHFADALQYLALLVQNKQFFTAITPRGRLRARPLQRRI